MSKLYLTLACRDYDRTRALMDGSVQPEGIELNYINLYGAETFWRNLRHAEFDISEISMSGYLITLERQPQPFIAIPIFPSRAFRHGAIFVNTRSGIATPRDLVGKRVGVPEYAMTANLWVRGMLQHDYGISPDMIQWFRGGRTKAVDAEERVELRLPPNIHLEKIPNNRYLYEMLESGDLDAIISTEAPDGFRRGSPRIARLFPDYKTAEMDYYRRTGIFPIMHTVVIKRTIHERHPWVALSLYKAFCEAKDICITRQQEDNGCNTLPWWLAELQAELQFFGGELWPYGVESNKITIDTLIQYSFEQGLTHRMMRVEELFAPETLCGLSP